MPPPSKCLKPESCNAGRYFTPTLEAIQVVPHKIETKATAKSAFERAGFSAVCFNCVGIAF